MCSRNDKSRILNYLKLAADFLTRSIFCGDSPSKFSTKSTKFNKAERPKEWVRGMETFPENLRTYHGDNWTNMQTASSHILAQANTGRLASGNVCMRWERPPALGVSTAAQFMGNDILQTSAASPSRAFRDFRQQGVLGVDLGHGTEHANSDQKQPRICTALRSPAPTVRAAEAFSVRSETGTVLPHVDIRS